MPPHNHPPQRTTDALTATEYRYMNDAVFHHQVDLTVQHVVDQLLQTRQHLHPQRTHLGDAARLAIIHWVAQAAAVGPTQVEVDLAIACSIGDQHCTRDAIDAITAARAAVRDLYAGR